MATSLKFVEVLCPSGRRQKVKSNPSMTVLQILEEVCKKQGYDDAEFDLKHQRKILNVTSMMRFLNLPNNAKLEMVKCEKARVVCNVTVALQMEDGSRQQDDFNPNLTLLDVLKRLVKEIEKKFEEFDPVCIYMRNEYRGESLLSNTSLKSIGITTGRAAFRLLFKEKLADVEANVLCKSSAELKVNALHQDSSEANSTSCELKEPNEKKICLENSHGKPTTSQHVNENDTKQYPRESSVPQLSAEGHAYTPLSIIGRPPQQIFPDDDKMFQSEEKYNPVPVSSATTANEFANFKFPESHCDVSDVEAIDPHLMKKEVKLGLPCERQAVLYSVANVKMVADGQEPDENFFQVTVDDLRKRLSHLKSDRKSMEDEALLTTALRQQKRIERVSDFEMIPVRLLLPGELILQGIFRPLETIGAIRHFLTDFLSDEMNKYELLVTPPRVILKDKSQTLYDAKLFPAAVVHVSFGTSAGPHVKQKYLDNLSNSHEAEKIVDHVLKRKHGPAGSTNDNPHNDSSSQCTPSSSLTANMSPNSDSFPNNKQPKGAPKWFKTGR